MYERIMKELCALVVFGLATYYILKKIYNSLFQHSDIVWEQNCRIFKELKWVLTSDEETCDRIVTFLIREISCKRFIGLDLEWDPCYIKGVIRRPDLIQLGVPTGYCLLYQVKGRNRLPSELVKLLCNPGYLKVGVGIANDVALIRRFFYVEVDGAIDLRAIAPPAPKMGLASLAEDHLYIILPKVLTLTKWSREVLSLDEQAYAARDAYIGALLAEDLASKAVQMYSGKAVDYLDIWRAKNKFEERLGKEWWRKTHLYG